ncbi:MAG TPA: hypothetical protein VGL27_15380 [Negativicutes bacterium]|jgi:hypothetical protein
MPITESEAGSPEEQNEQQKGKVSKRAQRMRERAVDAISEDAAVGLEQIFETKLAAIQSYERQLETVRDPFAQQALRGMIRKERKELLHLAELTELMEKSPELGRFTRARLRLNHRIKTNTGQDMIFWLGAAAIGAILVPGVREKLRPIAVKAVQGVMGLSDQAQGFISGIKEDIEDIVSEVQFEKIKQSLDSAIEEDANIVIGPEEQ